jgi:lactoylglutathione lyase
MAIIRLDHVDLAVSDVERSLAWYLGVLGPLGCEEAFRYPSYRGTEEIIYLRLGQQHLGLRPADDHPYRYYGVGLEHLAVIVERREDVEETYQRSLALGVDVQFPPEEDRDIPGYWELFLFDPDGLRIEVAYYPPGGPVEV